ncbi:MAG: hypothetical protein HYV23_04360 [Deltaproteobacteria bacterium]|nr:hypothetical protein [Deltaproteobacteria bacterium]
MDRIKAVRIIAVAVAVSGLVEMLGWFFGVQALKSVLPSMVTMKFTTAVSFFLSGITLFYIAESARGRASVAQAIIPVTTLMVMLIMATLLASSLFDLKTGIEDLFVEEEAAAVKTTVPGRPSLVTMADFIVFAAVGIGSLFRYRGQKHHLFFSGVFITATGVLALSGYILGIEYLFFSWPGVSTGMALVTAILFELLGAGLILLSRAF